MFGEAFGGVFAPGLSWLTGAPGAVLLYVAAGVLLALPASAWPRTGRIVLGVTGACWAGLAVLQAWPGRGFWQGGDSGTLTGMVASMARVSQPRAQAAMVSAFASLARAHGFAVNLVAVLALGTLGLAIASGSRRVLRLAAPAAVVFCVADWALVQDLGMPGGLGTDPGSMPPWAVLLMAGYLALIRPHDTTRRPARAWLSLAAAGASVVGAVPMAVASMDRNADPVIARAITGRGVLVDRPAPGFWLLGADASRAELVAIPATATHAAPALLRGFDRTEGMAAVPDWLFLTGTLIQLQRVWNSYETIAPGMMAGMMGYSDVAFVIDAAGRIRQEIRGVPGPDTSAAHSSFAVLLSDAVRQVLMG